MRIHRPLPALIALSLLIPGCAKSGKPGASAAPSYNDYKSSHFVDVAKQAGINFTADTGIGGKRLYFIESTPAGGGFVDIDRDGNLDVILLQPGASSVDQLTGPRALTGLFRNNGDGTFTDAIKGSGLDKDLGFAHGVAVADYDNDGYSDILVTAYPRNFLFRNLGGAGKFQDVSVYCPVFVSDNHFVPTFNNSIRWLNPLFNILSDNPGLLNFRLNNLMLKANLADIFIPSFYDTYFFNSLGRVKVILPVHDMIHEKYPDFISGSEKVIENKKRLIKRNIGIIRQ
jgi:hypothetical protein